MKIIVVDKIGLYKPIASRLELEGDEVEVVSSLDTTGLKADLVISELDSTVLPGKALETIGIPIFDKEDVDFFVIKRLDNEVFDYQTIVGIPLLRLMNNNLGPKAEMGSCFRFIQDSPLSDLFRSPSLLSVLNKMGYKGFVVFKCSFRGGDKKSFSITGIELGLPYFLFYSIIESIPGRVADFFKTPSRLMESWVSSLVVSVFPYPVHRGKRVTMECPEEGMLRHFWMPYVTRYERSLYTDHTLVGVATAWATELEDSVKRALVTCRSLNVEFKQYRTDGLSYVREKWCHLRDMNLV